MIPLLLRFKSYLIILGVLSALFGWGMWERGGKLSIKAELVAQQAELDKVLAENKRKETENEERIKTAVTERESLLRQLHDNQVRLSTVQRTLAATGIDRKCYKASELNSAYGILVSEIRAIAGEGDASLIDNKGWMASWPR